MSSASSVNYYSIGSTFYGNDGSECEVFANELICYRSGSNPVSYYNIGSTFYGNDGSECEVFANELNCRSNSNYGYTSAPGDLAYEAGYGASSVINQIADAMIQGMKNEKSIKANTYTPPVIKNSLRNTPFYNFDTTYKADGVNFSGSDGIRCSYFSENELNCNNGVNYYLSSPTKMRGSDGTTYVSDWKNDSNNSYYCVTSSFGSKCCGNRTSKTCSSRNKIPANAYATSSGWRCNNGYLKISDECKKVTNQSTYINKEPDKARASNQTMSSIPKPKSNNQTTFGFSGLQDFFGFLAGLSFLGFVLWWIFKDLINSLIKRFFNND